MLLCLFLVADETIVFIRHGEKPQEGLGQLNKEGLERALKLPYVFEAKFGKPSYIFACNPAYQKFDKGILYYYIRPLATIEPTAIYFSMPVQLPFGFDETTKIADELKSSKYKDALIFVAWEHHKIKEIIQKLMPQASELQIPNWQNDDFNSIYIVKINQEKNSIVFSIDQEF